MVGCPGLMVKTMAEGAGNAPTSANAEPVFGTGAASSYLPAFQETSNAESRAQNRPHSAFFTLHSALKMVGGAGNAPVVTSDSC